ncbi:hypothetical protein V6768_19130 [Tistrella mobilis]
MSIRATLLAVLALTTSTAALSPALAASAACRKALSELESVIVPHTDNAREARQAAQAGNQQAINNFILSPGFVPAGEAIETAKRKAEKSCTRAEKPQLVSLVKAYLYETNLMIDVSNAGSTNYANDPAIQHYDPLMK